MNYVSKFLSNFKEFYNEINSATLTGAIDVVVVQQEDGSYTCSPFHVRFGKIGVLRSREKVVDIEINGDPVDIHMKLGETGEAFFVEEIEESDEVPTHLATSPIPSYPDIEQELAKLKDERYRTSDSTRPRHERKESQVFVRNGSHVFIQVDDSNPVPSMQGSVYYETSETMQTTTVTASPECITTPCVVNGQATIPKFDTLKHESERRVNPNDLGEAPQILNMASLAKAFGHTSISDSALAVIDASTRNNHYRDTNSESSSLNNHFFPVSAREDIVDRSITRLPDKGFTLNQVAEKAVPPKNFEQSFPIDDEKLKTKKKRRKKSVIRKKRSREVASAADSSDDEPEEIFQMDVDDDMMTQTKISSSVPSASRKLSNTVVPSSIFLNVEEPSIPSFSSRSAEVVRSTSSLHDLNLPSTSAGHADNWQFKSSLPLNLEIHPFSDGDVTPIMSPVTSRPPTPKSDTEYETRRGSSGNHMDYSDNRWSWTWGELPVPPKSPDTREQPTSDEENTPSKPSETEQEQEERSMLGGMFRFMRKTKKMRHQPEKEGIYLDDLNLEQLDPEIAKLYFPPRTGALRVQSSAMKTPMAAKDEDVESGNGSSLPQSPHSIEGGSGSFHGGIDSDSDEHHPVFDFKGYHDLAISLCGGLAEFDHDIPQERFLHSLITYDDFCENPSVLNNPDLVVRLNNKYYNWQTVAPMVLSLILYQRPLSDRTVRSLVSENMPKKPKKSEPKGYSWWPSWRRSGSGAVDEDGSKKPEDPLKTEEQNKMEETKKLDEPKKLAESMKIEDPKSENVDLQESPKAEPTKVKPELDLNFEESLSPNLSENVSSISDGPTESTPCVPLKHVREETTCAATSSDAEDVVVNLDISVKEEETKDDLFFPKGIERYRKTLRLSSDQISQLNLREGPNEVVFSVTTAYQGTTRCKCHIYLWRHDDKIVVSDIDGTITKSDVLGHILPIIGKDWAQSGVAQLFTKIKNNGYQFLYLSARAIGQARITREYLKSIRQGDVCLPDGPLLLNPSSLLSALHREVIEKKPEEFKISCLRDIQALFPSDTNCFYAGYGNRINDVWAYRAVGIPYSRTFTINHRGELKHELTNTFQSTYTGLSNVVDHLFPPLRRPITDGILGTDFEGPEEYSAFTYWRQPIPDVSLDDSPVRRVTEKAKSDEKKTKSSSG